MVDPALHPTELSPAIGHLPAGTVLAERYEIAALLGAGGMGAVYRALDRELGEPIALKVLRPEIATNPDALERFRREVKLARRVTHPNVARTYDLGSGGGLRFLTMELVDGEPLARRLGRPPHLELPEALRIAGEIARGLAAAHAVGVVHRDMKPENVMLAGPRVVLTDFGIARLAAGEESTTRTGAAVGTPAYMAPEQLEAGPVDGRADVYALGLVLYEMLTGEVAFAGDSPYSVAVARLLQPPPDPRARTVGLPDAVAELVVASLARQREQRLDAASVLARIEALRGGGAAPLIAALPASTALRRLTTARTGAVAPRSGTPGGSMRPGGKLAVAVTAIEASGDAAALAADLHRAMVDAIAGHASAVVVDDAAAAEAVVGGSLRIAGGRARLRLRLQAPGSATPLGSEVVDGDATAPFDLEDLAARAIVALVERRVRPAPARRGPTDPVLRATYDAARTKYERFGLPFLEEAIALLEEAERTHPGDPWIQSLLAASIIRSLGQREAPSPGDLARAEDLALRALASDPSLGEAYATIAQVRSVQGEMRATLRACEEALSRDPTLAAPHAELGRLLCESGYTTEGLARLDVAQQLEPQSGAAARERATTLALLGDRAGAESVLDSMEAILGPLGFAVVATRLALWWRDSKRGARAAAILEAAPGAAAWKKAAQALRAMDQPEPPADLELALKGLMQSRAAPGIRQFFGKIAVENLAYFGKTDAALDMLVVAAQAPLIDLLWLDRCPLLDDLRGDARFAQARAVVAARVGDLWA